MRRLNALIIPPLLAALAALAVPRSAILAQTPRDSTDKSSTVPLWQDSVRYGGGPSVGAPRYPGAMPPSTWCLNDTSRPMGDFGIKGGTWMETSRMWLREVLSDTTQDGNAWRAVLGGAPKITDGDSILTITDDKECGEIARIINRDVLGWATGPTPVVVFRVRDHLIAYPSNARMGEFGMAVGMSLKYVIRGVATW